jgi:hypothetical protein
MRPNQVEDRKVYYEPLRPPDEERDTIGQEAVVSGNSWYHVIIIRVENGWRIQIGCKEFVSTSWSEINEALVEYWNNPEMARKRYCNNSPNCR